MGSRNIRKSATLGTAINFYSFMRWLLGLTRGQIRTGFSFVLQASLKSCRVFRLAFCRMFDT